MFDIKSNSVEYPERLRDAFHIFNDLSRGLIDSYHELESQVVRLKDELASARGERLRTLIEKERLADRLQRLLEALPGGVVVLDGESRVIENNSVAGKLLGEPLVGLSWREIAERSFLSMTDNPHERRMRRGGYLRLSVSSAGEGGQIILLTDVSEMRALQEIVDHQKRLTAMGEMVASMAHQVRTPLSSAILYAAHLGKAELREEQRLRFSQKVLERLRHLERQVNDMLSFARGGHIGVEAFPLERLLKKVSESMESFLTSPAVSFDIRNWAPVRSVVAHEDALLSILMNLLANAAEAVGTRGAIVMTVSQRNPGVLEFSVADNGPGISERDRERIFEPFFTTRTNGTGLGLAVVDAVIRAHGGNVRCESRPGGGTVFYLTLPREGGEALLPGGFSENQHATRSHAR
ncbi:MAG: ATP-binding protein [Pseudomonadota bacterium]